MKNIVVPIFITLFSFVTIASESSNRMFARQNFELEALNSAEALHLTPEEIKQIEITVFYNRQDRGFKYLLNEAWKRLLAEGRVKKLTPDLREKLGIQQASCSPTHRRSDLVAVYLPSSHYFLVDFEEVNKETTQWFFHELVHAVQYIYRFPLDIEILFQYMQTSSPDGVKIRRDQLVEYLRFFYEAQANWYTLRLERNRDWMNVRQNKLVAGTIVTFKTILSIIPVFKSIFDELLPEIDHRHDGTELNMGGIDLYEMIMVKKFHAINPGVHFDFAFIERYVRALEKAYFCELDFLYQPNNGDQKIYRDLHNKFYQTFGYQTPNLLNRCNSTFEAVQNGSPYINWLTLPKEQLNCGPYENSTFLQNRDMIIEIFENSEKSGSYMGGTRGGGPPTLKISPYIQPQIIFLPE